jgi:hypothetical protein
MVSNFESIFMTRESTGVLHFRPIDLVAVLVVVASHCESHDEVDEEDDQSNNADDKAGECA